MSMSYQVCFPCYPTSFLAAPSQPAALPVMTWAAPPPSAASPPAPAIALSQEAPARAAPQASRARPRRQRHSGDLPLRGNVWLLTRDRVGCRRVQAALTDAETDVEREALARELQGHVWEAVFCPHGNYVIQEVVASMRASSCAFVVDEIARRGAGGVCKAARHPFGCRVLQRMLEHWPEQAERLVVDLLTEGLLLCRHEYGTYVVSHILEYGLEEHRSKLIREMEQHAMALGGDPRAGGPLAKAIAHGCDDDRARLARALLAEPGLLPSMARARHGHVAVQNVLQLCGPKESGAALRQLGDHSERLRSSRYGRAVLHSMSGLAAFSIAGA